MGGFVDRERASDLLRQYDLVALVLCEPEAFRYATGVAAGPASLFRRAGAAFVVIPQRPDLPLGAIVTEFDAERVKSAVPELLLATHPDWIEMISLVGVPASGTLEERLERAAGRLDRPAGFSRPATFDLNLAIARLREVLTSLGLSRGRLGFDLDFVPAADLKQIAAGLDSFSVVNGSPVVDRLRAIKNEREIALLEQGLSFSEQGFARLASDSEPGMLQSELIELYRAGIREAAERSGHVISSAEYMSLGAYPKKHDERVAKCDPLKADMVCTVDGYQSDMSRNFVFGPPSADQARLHAIAEEAFEAGFDSLRPGRTMAEVHRAASASLERAGLGSYQRGHFGHGVGLSVFSEQWPFIAAGGEVEIEPGMVLAFEIPLYIHGIASFNLEDQVLITPQGPRSMNKLPRKLGIIG